MWEIGEFSRLRELDCSGNNLTRLDLRKCPDLQKLDCGDNEITSLDIDGLRGLAVLDCAGNLLARLDLKSNSSLRQLDCRGNPAGDARPDPPARGSCRPTRATTLSLRPSIASARRASIITADRGGRPLTGASVSCPPRIVFRWLPASVSCWLSVSVSRRLPALFPAGSPRRFPAACPHCSPLPTSFPVGCPRRFPSVAVSVSCRSRRCLLPSAAGLRHAYF